MSDLYANNAVVESLEPGARLSVSADAAGSALVERFHGGVLMDKTAVAAGKSISFGEYFALMKFRVTCFTGITTISQTTTTDTVGKALTVNGEVQIALDYAAVDTSYQPVAADMTVASGAGSNVGTAPKFLGAIMGNILGDAITGAGNYLGGLIGAFAATGTHGTDYPTAGVMGIIMDSAVDVDAAVLAVIDGDDPSGVTRARAAFGVRMLNNNVGSGVDYGLDLHDTGSAHYTGTGEDFIVTKAAVRMADETCIMSGAGVPVDYTDGSPAASGEGFAGPGSLYVDTTNAKLYVNGGTKAQPVWKIVTSAS